MAVIQTGAGVRWGLSGFSVAGTGVSTGTGVVMNYQSLDYRNEAGKRVQIENSIGETIGCVYGDEHRTCKIDILPSADTIAHILASGTLPVPGAIITITDSGDPQTVGTVGHSGKYNYVSGDIKRTKDGPMFLTFELEQWGPNDVSVLIS